MCPMEQSGNIRLAEEFDDKPKCSIAHHVDRVSASLQPFFPNSRTQDGEQDQVKTISASRVGKRIPFVPGIGSPRQQPDKMQLIRAHMTVKTMQG